MFKSTRRTVVLSAAAAAAAFGLDKRLAIAAPEVPTQKKPAPSTQRRPPRNAQTPAPLPGLPRYEVGAAECTALYDGIWAKAHGTAFTKNVSHACAQRALAAGELSNSSAAHAATA